MSEPHQLDTVAQAAAIRRGELDPVELVRHYLDRIDRLSDLVGAFVTVTPDAALAAATAARRLLGDRRKAGPLPPLLGVPTGLKDLVWTPGVRTTMGSRAFADFVPDVEDEQARLLRAAGAVSLGKTNTPEFGLPCYTEPEVAPPARCPWDTARSAGGSSGGAAAAVAAGLLPAAPGSDGGGSVRIPASCCGLVGLKVTRGRTSNGPRGSDATGLAWPGPIARTVRDAAALLDVMAGPVVGDPYPAAPPPDGRRFVDYVDRPPPSLRIGRYRTPVIADAPVHRECVTAYEEATRLLDSLGHRVEETAPPFGPGLTEAFETVWTATAAAIPLPPARERLLRPLTRWLRARGRRVSAPALLRALGQLTAAARAAVRATDGLDVVLTPTLAAPAPPVGALRNDADPAADFAAQKRFTPFTAAYNVTGQPAISLPLHWTDGGLPVGVQLVGRPGGEPTLLALAGQLEAACPWASRHPALW